jgi:hypothetical protein
MNRSPIKPKLKPRKCKHCKEPFMQERFGQSICTTDCAIKAALLAQKKKIEAAKSENRHEIREKLAKFKTRADWMREAQIAWNSYVRARDAGLPCCSCGSMPEQKFGGSVDCSHYRSRGSAPHLRFHLHNAASACVKCNRFLGGNIAALRIGLIRRIGIEKVLAIEQNNEPRKFDIEYLARIKKIFTKKAKRTAKRHFREAQMRRERELCGLGGVYPGLDQIEEYEHRDR